MSADSVHWDLTSFFPSFDSDERHLFEAEIGADLAALTESARKLGAVGGAESGHGGARSVHLAQLGVDLLAAIRERETDEL